MKDDEDFFNPQFTMGRSEGCPPYSQEIPMTETKTILTEAHKEFLNDLRDSGETNMWGAPPYVEEAFDVTEKEARAIVLAWMHSFDKEK